MIEEMFPISNSEGSFDSKLKSAFSFQYGKGKVIYIPQLVQPEGEIKLGFESIWEMPTNASELESAVYWAAGKILPMTVTAPEWVGVSHDTQEKREVIHLFNYNSGHLLMLPG